MSYPQPQYQPQVQPQYQQPAQDPPPMTMPRPNPLQGGYPPPPQAYIPGAGPQQVAFNQQHVQMAQAHQGQGQAYLGPQQMSPEVQAAIGLQQQRDPAYPQPQPPQAPQMQQPPQAPQMQQPPSLQQVLQPAVPPAAPAPAQEILTGFTPPTDPAESLGGYGVEGPAPPPQAELPPPGVMKEFAQVKGLSKADAANWSKYATEGSLDKEQVAGLTSSLRASIDSADRANQEFQAQTQAETARERDAWNKELMSHPEFANNNADQFVTSRKNVATVVKNFCPELYEELASSKHMLRPSLIIGLNRMAQTINGSNQSLVQGNPYQQQGTGQGLSFYDQTAAQAAAAR